MEGKLVRYQTCLLNSEMRFIVFRVHCLPPDGDVSVVATTLPCEGRDASSILVHHPK